MRPTFQHILVLIIFTLDTFIGIQQRSITTIYEINSKLADIWTSYILHCILISIILLLSKFVLIICMIPHSTYMYFFCVPQIWVPSPSAIHMVHPGKCCRDDLDFIAVLASFQNSKIETTSLQEAVSVLWSGAECHHYVLYPA